ncbi:ATP-dependent RNA helicase TDRD9-like [Tubulanus polymorphus]|uniref:ATP-dependent RNA helicase TDRD9-like n=1 Tax=Tubulanus polymorphus TaxID=672921 RepID=UPI003DA66C7A
MSRTVQDLTLEQIDDWFAIGKTVKAETHSRSVSGGKPLDEKGQPCDPEVYKPIAPAYKIHTRVNGPVDYAAYYQEKYLESLRHKDDIPEEDDDTATVVSASTKMDEIETASYISGSVATLDSLREQNNDVYKEYDFDTVYDKKLPITQFHDEIIHTIESNPVTVIQGSTGSGKTTQVPQYILDYYALENKYCNIIVTQPRRIAAMSIAKRVCSERHWNIGGICGYQVARDRVGCDDTRILYVTTGVLLEKLINTKNMLQYTHVILDEVHERDQDTDFSLLVVRKLLRENSKHVKVILMSATINAALFADYFGVPVGNSLEPAPVVDVEGKIYNVGEYYIENLKSLGELPADPSMDKPSLNSISVELAGKLITHFDKLEKQELGIMKNDNSLSPKRGTVLIFLPGFAEISEVMDNLNQYKEEFNLMLLPLHSSITLEEQAQVFLPPEPGMRKIILSTNIAESSITVPDIKYVIDFCLTKVLWCDPDTNITSLIVTWAAKANCLQRKGRAGRVTSGRVYRMVTRYFYEELPDYGTPEMLRCPLEQVILKCKKLNMGEPKALFALALSPPPLDDIERTILMLKEVAALTTHRSGQMNPHDGDLTFIGNVLASLPVDIHVGRMLILGYIFGVLEDCLIIGACLSLPSFFQTPFKEKFSAYGYKVGWSRWTYSDCFAMKNAYVTWEQNKRQGKFRRGGVRSERAWCRDWYLQIRRLREVEDLIKELTNRLSAFKITLPPNRPNRVPNPQEDELMLKIVLCGAFYPNYFVRIPVNEAEAVKELSGNDPFTSVMMKGLPQNQGALYRHQIENVFQNRYKCGKIKSISFEDSRAYIEFEPSGNETGTVRALKAVYLAVKVRQCERGLNMPMLDPDAVRQRFETLTLQQLDSASGPSSIGGRRLRTNRIRTVNVNNSAYNQVALPRPTITAVPVVVSHIVTCGHFWAFYFDNSLQLDDMQKLIESYMAQGNAVPPKNIGVGTLCLAPFEEDGVRGYYRARIVELKQIEQERTRELIHLAVVFFVDYGNTSTARINELASIPDFLLTPEWPFQAIKCQLACLRPSSIRSNNGEWSKEAVEFFKEQVYMSQTRVIAQVYSVMNNKLRVTVVVRRPDGREVNINEELKKKRLAEEAEEPFLSKQSFLQRQKDSSNLNYADDQDDEWLELKIGNENIKRKKQGMVRLTGPWNPYEIGFASYTCMGKFRVTRLEQDSVNSVCIDDEPQDPHERLMVAAHVGLNPSGNTLICRNTTVMPNIRGLPALMSMIFSPTMEIRRNPEKTCFIGAICGLGADPETGGSALPDHDMEITFDVEIDQDDINEINGVRIGINYVVGHQEPIIQWSSDAIDLLTKKVRSNIINLLEKKRKYIEPTPYTRPYQWGHIPDEDVLEHCITDESANSRVLLELHNSAVLNLEPDTPELPPFDHQKRMIEHVQLLRSKAGRSTEQETIVCELCNVTCYHPRDLMIHLHTLDHQVKERNLI